MKLDYGGAVRRVREARRMTQQEVARAAGIEQSYLSLLERGLRDPSLPALGRVAQALRLPLFAVTYLATPAEALAPLPQPVRDDLARLVEGALRA